LWCPWATKASQRAATLVDRLRDGWQHLLRDRATRSLTYNDEQFHVLERIKVYKYYILNKFTFPNPFLQIKIEIRKLFFAKFIKQVTETGRRLKALLETECIPAMTQLSECVADWYKMAQTVFLQTQILDKDIDNYERVLESFSYRLSQESKERNENLLHSLDRLPGKSKTMEKTSVPVQESTKKWRNICDTQEQIAMLLCENDLLIDQLDHLSMIERLEDGEWMADDF